MKLINLIKFFIITFILSSCSNSGNKQLKDVDKIDGKVKPIEVTVMALKRQDFQKQLVSNGKISSAQSCIIRPESGIIKELKVLNGQFVKQGDTLAILENQQQKLDLEQSLNGIKKGKVDFQDDLLMAGYRNMQDTADISPELMNNLRSKSGYTQALLNYKKSLINYERTFIIAPFSGIVANMKDQLYNRISPEFCTLYNPEKMAIDFKLLEMDIGSIFLNQKLKLSPFNNSALELEARISEINPEVDKNGLVNIKALIKPHQNAKLFIGQNARILIEHSIPNQFVVPREAIVLRSNKYVLFHYLNGLSKWVYVKILHENEKYYAIEGSDKGSLKEGYQVIVTNNLNLAHDAEVALRPMKSEK